MTTPKKRTKKEPKAQPPKVVESAVVAHTEDTPVVVSEIKKIPGVSARKAHIATAGGMSRRASYPSVSGVVGSAGGNFYSPHLSTDFLELPQSQDEKRSFYRHFYDNDPFVGQAVDLITEIPISKIRFGKPKSKNRELAERSLRFCQKWSKRIGFLHRMIEIVHEYNLLGEAYVFPEDTSPEMPDDVIYETIHIIQDGGSLATVRRERADAAVRKDEWLRKNYKGWTALRVLPPEQVHMESFNFTDEKLVELIPDSKTKDIISKANSGDPSAERIRDSMPEEIVNAVMEGRNIPLNTDPDKGSFVFHMARKKSQYQTHGNSILGRCLLPGTKVSVSRGGHLQEIPCEDVNPETDLFLSHKGNFCKGTKGSRPVDEEAVEITLFGKKAVKIQTTSDHKYLRVNPKTNAEDWVQAHELKKGDYLRGTFPTRRRPNTVVDFREFWAQSEVKRTPGGVTYPKNPPAPGAYTWDLGVSVSQTRFRHQKAFCYLMGVWAAYGTVSLPSLDGAGYGVTWRLEKNNPNFVEMCLQHCFGAQSYIKEEHKKHIYYTIPEALFARWVHETFYVDGVKSLPTWFMELPATSLYAFVSGIYDEAAAVRDFNHTKHPQIPKGTIELRLYDRLLAEQVSKIFHRLNITHFTSQKIQHTRFQNVGEGKYRRRKPAGAFGTYYINFYPGVRRTNYKKIIRFSAWNPNTKRWRQMVSDAKTHKWPLYKIKRTKKFPYKGPVYSFDVEGDESHTANGVVVHNCMKTLVYRDKLRQSQTQISSRHMTPIRIVWAENMDAADTDALREQVDLALMDPDFSIVTNFEIHWEEMGSDQRLLDLTSEYDMTDRQMYAGLGVTESLLSGESSYSGDRINLEVINARFMLLREILQSMVEEHILKPMCKKMGFLEIDEDGDEVVVCPSLSFTRLALRDNADTFDALFSLYNKGSLDIGIILELLNLDPDDVKEKLELDLMTVNDSAFNEVLRGAYGEVGRLLPERTDIVKKIAEALKLIYAEPTQESESRF
jgi:hypothetical protein